ncbi:MAG: hypothetical protein Kow0092_28150 [Deferrisomatales bacterium]
MKRTLAICGAGALALVLAGGALAQTMTIPDTTLIQRWRAGVPDPGGTPPEGWFDVVGFEHTFQTERLEVSWQGADVILSFFTNFPRTGAVFGHPAVAPGEPLFRVADAAVDLDRDGTWEVGIALSDHAGPAPAQPGSFYQDPPGTALPADAFTEGGVYAVTAWFSANDLHDNHVNQSIGGRYDVDDPKIPPVWMRLGSEIGQASIVWTDIDSPDHRVDITLAGVNADGSWNQFDLLWGSSTCANDVVTGPAVVPVPPTVWLLGTGLLGVGAEALRRTRGQRA